jgi:AraC-like DNA-binding protein
MEEPALPGCQVIAVAGRVEFDSPSAFSKAFRNFTGEKPKHYRNRIVGNLLSVDHASRWQDGSSFRLLGGGEFTHLRGLGL